MGLRLEPTCVVPVCLNEQVAMNNDLKDVGIDQFKSVH